MCNCVTSALPEQEYCDCKLSAKLLLPEKEDNLCKIISEYVKNKNTSKVQQICGTWKQQSLR